MTDEFWVTYLKSKINNRSILLDLNAMDLLGIKRLRDTAGVADHKQECKQQE